MNIFALDMDPVIAAAYHCDKHVPKMIIESAQMLSTAHHMLDGKQVVKISKSGRNFKTWTNNSEALNCVLFKAVHFNHPCTVWTREASENYKWLWQLALALCKQFELRYKKRHATKQLIEEILIGLPENIPTAAQTPFARAMKSQPQCLAIEDDINCYRAFYLTKRSRMSIEWKKLNNTPYWVTI